MAWATLLGGIGAGCEADRLSLAGQDVAAQAEAEVEPEALPEPAPETVSEPEGETAVEPGVEAFAEVPVESAPDAPQVCAPTQGDAQSPFYLEGAPFTSQIAGPEEPGQRLRLSGRVLSPECAAIPGALLDVWQADASGAYPDADQGLRLRGRLLAGEDGTFAFETVLPGFYEGRPRHLHLKASADGFTPLTTQLYFAGDPYLWPNDSCGPPSCHSDDPARILKLVEVVEQGRAVLLGRVEITLAP